MIEDKTESPPFTSISTQDQRYNHVIILTFDLKIKERAESKKEDADGSEKLIYYYGFADT